MTPAAASVSPTPLLQKLETLQCAVDAKAAQQTLSELVNISPPGQEWPDEWLGQKPQTATLYAGTLDIALYALKATAERFPSLREEAERVALQWNYCDVLEGPHFYDLLLRQKKVEKLLAAEDAPLKWDGFRQWGFLEPDPAGRFVPKLLDEIRLAPHAYHLFLHRAYRQRCFPHPETGLLVSEAEAPREALLGRDVPTTLLMEQQPIPYPYTWKPSCQTVKPPPLKPVETRVKTAGHPVKKPPVSLLHRQPPRPPPLMPVPPLTPAPPAGMTVAQVASPPALLKPSKVDMPAFDKMVNPPAGRVVLPATAGGVPGGDIPLYFEGERPVQAHGTTGIVSTDGQQKLRVAGSFADTISLKDGSNTLSASATWSPKPNWFVSGNVSVKAGKPGYAWSAGYADWKPGTWSAQINNWGPLKPGEGLALDKAVANVGYKVKSAKLEKRKLAASANLSVPLKGKPSASATLQWNPKPNWYARATLSKPLAGGQPSWNYGLGYADQHPGKWRIEYANYAKNRFPGDKPNEGAITISRGWQF